MSDLVDVGLVHPGEMLREEFLEPLGITAYRVATDIGVSRATITELVRERKGISSKLADLLGVYFGMSAGFWMNLQTSYEIRKLKQDKKHQAALRKLRALQLENPPPWLMDESSDHEGVIV